MVRLSSIGFAGILLCASVTGVFAHSYGPAPRLTAGPGDSTRACTGCHTGTLNSGSGSVKISLLSGNVYIPGVKQRITVQVADPGQQRWGFELSARLDSEPQNGQAGDLSPVDNFTQVICEDAGPKPCATGVQFVQHTSAGTRRGTKGGASFQFEWTPPATDVGPVTLYVAGNAANGDGNLTGDLIYTSSVQLKPIKAVAPAVQAGSILSSATLAAGPVAPNSWITIYGTNLSPTTRSWDESDFRSGGMPTSLDGVSVVLNAFGAPRSAYIGYVSPGQINALLPSDTNATTVQVQVKNPAGITSQLPITVAANAPQLLTLDGKYALATHANGSIVGKSGLLPGTATSGATAGETVTFYCTGCGATNPALVPGQVPTDASRVATPPTVTIGGASANVVSAAVLPNSAGVYTLTVQVPSGAAKGDLPVTVQSGTFTSAATLITIGQ